MTLFECFQQYELASIQLDDRPSGDGLSLLPIVKAERLDNEAMDNINDAICELLGNQSFTEGDYEYLFGFFTCEDTKVIFEGTQVRDVTFTLLN
jgi:hypothetical protein